MRTTPNIYGNGSGVRRGSAGQKKRKSDGLSRREDDDYQL